MIQIVTRQIRGKWVFGRVMPNGKTIWYGGSYTSEKNAHRAAEKRITGYKYKNGENNA